MRRIRLPKSNDRFDAHDVNKYYTNVFYVDDFKNPTIAYTWPRIHLPWLSVYNDKRKKQRIQELKWEYSKRSWELFMKTYPDMVRGFAFHMKFHLQNSPENNKRTTRFSNLYLIDDDTGHKYTMAWAFTQDLLHYISEGIVKVNVEDKSFEGVFAMCRRQKKYYIKPLPLHHNKVKYA